MKTLVFATVLLFGICSMTNAQIEEKMKAENVVKGAIFKNGEEIEGYIKAIGKVYESDINEEYPAPWEFQGDIRFIPKDVFENTEKIKGKLYQKYGPKDISGYRYEDLFYESVKYADMSAVGLNMLSKKMFLLRIVDDKISIFYHYQTPPSVVSRTRYIDCAKEHIIYRKGADGKLKLLEAPSSLGGLNMDKDWEDCPYVKEKQANGGYSGSHIEVRLEAIADYNKNCK
jgi:hypothetical protein